MDWGKSPILSLGVWVPHAPLSSIWAATVGLSASLSLTQVGD